MWRLVGCAESVFARSDDGSGRLADGFHAAARDLGPLAQAATLDPAGLAARAFEALRDGGYGQWEELVPVLAPQLGAAGLGHLRRLVEAWRAEPVAIPPEAERRVIGWGSAGKLYADEVEAGHRRRTAILVLRQIADAAGDVDGYIAQLDARSRGVPAVAAGIARRLLDAGRAHEAIAAIDAAKPPKDGWRPAEWEQARIDALEALGRAAEAQAFRWERFLATLDATHLRAHLRKLPDVAAIDTEERAMAHALAGGDIHRALAFLIEWPDLERANRLVTTRARELDGNLFELLSPAGDALDARYPLAATLVRRAMIDFTLGAARTSRYKHAARHLAECAGVAKRVADFGAIPDHAAYARALRAAHGRKAAFWQEVAAFG